MEKEANEQETSPEPITLPSLEAMRAANTAEWPDGGDLAGPHVCWLCGRKASRRQDRLWYSIWRAFDSGNLTVWLCQDYCFKVATLLVDGLPTLPNQPGWRPLRERPRAA